MKNQRHKRKEFFTILLISNTDRKSRQFQLSLLSVRLAVIVLLLLCGAAGVLIYQFTAMHRKQDSLRAQLAEQKRLTQELQTGGTASPVQNGETTAQAGNAAGDIQMAEGTQAAAENVQAADGEAPAGVKDSDFPSLYPSQGTAVLKTAFSPEQPYLTLNTYTGNHIIAAGDGTVTTVSSDETYTYIIEIQHASGYTTRYLCRQDAELNITQGTQVQAGTVLLTITADDTQIDYQVIYENAPVDPFTIIDAKG